jgi:hypothetical protein
MPCRECIFQEEESGIVEPCLFSMKLLAMVKGGAFDESMGSGNDGIIEHWADITDL